MVVPAWSALGRLHSTPLDGSSFHWIPNGSRTVRLDLFSRLGGLDLAGGLCRRHSTKASAILYIAHSLGRTILYLCLASDMVCRFRDGNAPAWADYPCCAGVAYVRFAPLPDPWFVNW